ncbi:hypothetical protein [Mesorhizobium sp. CN2-181]|uniref:hypothetical protein n=1 Tax=Mesorhizobium yinganensis TaxID=3157707 RepID=UPI0032B7A689
MTLHGTANPEQIDTLCAALGTFRELHELTNDDDRNDAAETVMAIFARGVDTFDGLMAAMEASSLNRLRLAA